MLFSCSVYADFDVRSEHEVSLPEDVDKKYEPRLKHPRTFREVQRYASGLETSQVLAIDKDRWYLKVGLNASALEVKKITNKVRSGTAPAASKNVLRKGNTEESTSQKKFQFGIGYVWEYWRSDAEYFINRKFKYNKSPLLDPNVGTITSDISVKSALVNIYYDFNNFIIFRPFLAISGGLSYHKATAITTNLGSTVSGERVVNKVGNFAYGTKIGARLRFMRSNFFLTGSYQYTNLGKAKWRDKNFPQALALDGNMHWAGFRIDLIYMI